MREFPALGVNTPNHNDKAPKTGALSRPASGPAYSKTKLSTGKRVRFSLGLVMLVACAWARGNS